MTPDQKELIRALGGISVALDAIVGRDTLRLLDAANLLSDAGDRLLEDLWRSTVNARLVTANESIPSQQRQEGV